MSRRYLALGVGLAAVFSLGPIALASDAITISGGLSPAVENPSAGAHGHGSATLTISADRTQLSWDITYSDVSSPITAVYFCAGTTPRVLPIGLTCAFVIPMAPGGPSPVTGSRTIVPAQGDTLSSGYAVIELDSALGPQLYGYVGPAPMDDATLEPPASPRSGGEAVLLLGAALAAFAFVLARGPSRRRPT